MRRLRWGHCILMSQAGVLVRQGSSPGGLFCYHFALLSFGLVGKLLLSVFIRFDKEAQHCCKCKSQGGNIRQTAGRHWSQEGFQRHLV